MKIKYHYWFILLSTIIISSCASTQIVDQEVNNPKTDRLLTRTNIADRIAKGGEIILPAGEFYIDQTTAIRINDTKIRGRGVDSTIIRFNPGTGIDIMANDVEFSDIHFTGTFKKDGNEQHTLNVRGPYSGLIFERLKITNGDDTGIRIGYALRLGKRAAAKGAIIRDCIIENINEGSGIEVMGASNVFIENNTISNTYQNGIRIAGGKSCILKNNIVENYNMQKVRYAYGIYAKGGNKSAIHDFCDDILIENNHIIGVGKNISVGTQTSNVIIKDNIIELQNDSTAVGISLENNKRNAAFGYKNILIENNKIFGSFFAGIQLHTRDNDPAISGQYVEIKNNSIIGFRNIGIYIRGNNFGEIKDIFIEGNVLEEKIGGRSKSAIIIAKCDNIFMERNILSEKSKINLLSKLKGSKVIIK